MSSMSKHFASIGASSQEEYELRRAARQGDGRPPIFGQGRPEDSDESDEEDPRSAPSSSKRALPKFNFDDSRELLDGKYCAHRVFVVEIAGSPRLFAENPELAKAKLTTPFSAQYRPTGTDIGSTRVGDTKNALLFNASVIWCSNDFMYPVMCKSQGIRGRYYHKTQRGFFCAPPGLVVSPTGIMVQHPTRSLNSATAKSYGNYTAGDHKIGVVAAGDHYIIDPTGNVTLDLIMNNQNNPTASYDIRRYAQYDSERRLTGYRVPSNIVESAHRCFHEKVLPSKPSVDLDAMTIWISRLGDVAWDDSFGMNYPGGNESADSKLLTMRGRLTMALEVKYRLAEK